METAPSDTKNFHKMPKVKKETKRKSLYPKQSTKGGPVHCCYCSGSRVSGSKAKAKTKTKKEPRKKAPYSAPIGKSAADIKLAALKLLNRNSKRVESIYPNATDAEVADYVAATVVDDVEMAPRGKRKRGDNFASDLLEEV